MRCIYLILQTTTSGTDSKGQLYKIMNRLRIIHMLKIVFSYITGFCVFILALATIEVATKYIGAFLDLEYLAVHLTIAILGNFIAGYLANFMASALSPLNFRRQLRINARIIGVVSLIIFIAAIASFYSMEFYDVPSTMKENKLIIQTLAAVFTAIGGFTAKGYFEKKTQSNNSLE
jgi:hypothetical protein